MEHKKYDCITIDFVLFNKCFSGENIYETEADAVREAKRLKMEFELKGLYPSVSIVYMYTDGEIVAYELDLWIHMNNLN
jgi:hypothetical protein